MDDACDLAGDVYDAADFVREYARRRAIFLGMYAEHRILSVEYARRRAIFLGMYAERRILSVEYARWRAIILGMYTMRRIWSVEYAHDAVDFEWGYA